MHRNRYCWLFIGLVAWLLPTTERMPDRTSRNETERKIMKFSAKGQDKLKKFEGFLNVEAPDRAGYPTIGYGHKIKQGERFGIISEQTALTIMLEDVSPLEEFLNNYIGKKLTQNQFDALIIFMYNIGDTAFLNSSVFRDIKDGKMEEATVPWAKWINITKKEFDPKTGKIVKKLIPVKGLLNRRLQEIQLFNT